MANVIPRIFDDAGHLLDVDVSTFDPLMAARYADVVQATNFHADKESKLEAARAEAADAAADLEKANEYFKTHHKADTFMDLWRSTQWRLRYQ